jgi:hypothetical protein
VSRKIAKNLPKLRKIQINVNSSMSNCDEGGVSNDENEQNLLNDLSLRQKVDDAYGQREDDCDLQVSELFDSLTPAAEYFSQGNRRRNRPRSYKEDELVSARGDGLCLFCTANYEHCKCPH